MRYCILLRVLTVFFLTFLAGQIFAFKIYQPRRAQSNNDSVGKLLGLQTSLAVRMSQHQSIISKHLQTVSSNLDIVSSNIDESLSNQFLLKDQVQNLPQEILNDHFETLADHFKVTGEDSKQDIAQSLDNIKQGLAGMQNETEEMELFIQTLSDEVMLLQADVLKGGQSEKERSNSTVNGEESQDRERYMETLASGSKDDEKTLLEDIFKNYINSTGVFPRAYSVVPEEHPDNTITRARYTVVFNATVPFDQIFALDNEPCDYSCSSRVEVKFDEPVAHEEIGFQYQSIFMNCTASAPGKTKNAIGEIGTGQSLMAIWFEQAPTVAFPEI